MTGVSVDVEGNIQVVAFVPLDSRPRTLSFSLFLYVFKPSTLTIYSTLLYEGGRLCFDPFDPGEVGGQGYIGKQYSFFLDCPEQAGQ